MMKQLTILLFLALLTFPALAQVTNTAAQEENPVSKTLNSLYKHDQDTMITAAEKMPEADYDFKPTPEMRSFAETLTGMISVQNGMCHALKNNGTLPPSLKKGLPKAEIVQALKSAYTNCDSEFESLTDDILKQKIKSGTREISKAVIFVGIIHLVAEQYAYLATYLRLKGIKPTGK